MGRIWKQTVGIVDGIGVLRLEHPNGTALTHYFDADLLDEVAKLSWSPITRGYLAARRNGPKITLHMLAIDPGQSTNTGLSVDHINRDITDSRRSNLRLATKREQVMNMSNQSTYGSGIQLHKGSYQVRICSYGNVAIFTPTFKSLDAATECRSKYLEIAIAVDAGARTIPTRAELKQIADECRVGHISSLDNTKKH